MSRRFGASMSLNVASPLPPRNQPEPADFKNAGVDAAHVFVVGGASPPVSMSAGSTITERSDVHVPAVTLSSTDRAGVVNSFAPYTSASVTPSDAGGRDTSAKRPFCNANILIGDAFECDDAPSVSE